MMKTIGNATQSGRTAGISNTAAAVVANPDWQLMDRIEAGDTEVFYELVRPHERSVFLSAFAILRNEADAEDCAQEAVLKAFQHISRFRRESKFSTWLIQIAINEAKMRLRKDRRHLYDSIDEPATDDEGGYIPRDFADWRPIPSEALEQSELREALNAALRSLPEKYASVLVLRDVRQLSIHETAAALGITEANVKVRLSRARLQMREALAPGFDASWMARTGRISKTPATSE